MRCNFHDYPSGVCDQNLDKSRDSFDPRWRPWYLARFVNEVAAVLLEAAAVLLEAGASMSAHDDFLRQHYDVLSSVDLFEDGFMKPLGVEYQKYDRDLLHRCFHHGHVTQATQVAKESTASGFNFNQTGRISESFSSSFESTGPSQLKNWVSRPECVPNSGPDHSPNQHTDPHPNRTVVLSRALNTTQTIAVAMILVIVVINLLVTRLTIPASSHRNAPSTHDDVDFKLTHLLSGSLDIVSVEDITGFMALLEGDLYPGMPDVQLEGYANEANLHIWHEQQIVQVTRSKHSQGDPSDVTSPNDDLMNTLAPLFMTQIENALEPVLGPVITALQNQGEEERMQRQKLIAQEEKKLALKREKVQRLKRHRACRFQPTRRARATNSSAKSPQLTLRQGLSLLKSSQSSAVKLSRVELLD
ncbi:hypothetical protein KC19_6G064600 [Ceratodon purpureus]|nr:hypothetical protein KC19_6G064600 [Ceratodon purpureus]KAG0569087.1 hypothetical protein KC19_6G064600 [Ceratodon purpureus]KAG0569095.1 hypothetical protein KC19_6G064600 [Ceratodon purpureus]KAG0569097.1 hypothetical protein KC19_6G064600 [Ceratodon purpureus]KAG0569099.1 hypothetical protein KC19_6G064600 [Ceratodon purpureus]